MSTATIAAYLGQDSLTLSLFKLVFEFNVIFLPVCFVILSKEIYT